MWIKQPGNGSLSKRQATLQLCIGPSEGKQPRAAIIFRGQGKRLSKAEKAAWDKRVDVYFQPKAWDDTNFSVAWVKRTLKAAVPGPGKEKVILLTDGLAAQVSAEFKAAAARSTFWSGISRPTAQNSFNQLTLLRT